MRHNCAVIHTDFERDFIKAEVIGYDDYITAGSEKGAKEKGLMRLEGKEYLKADGDIMHLRFNVYQVVAEPGERLRHGTQVHGLATGLRLANLRSEIGLFFEPSDQE